jgi:hypothetical protein
VAEGEILSGVKEEDEFMKIESRMSSRNKKEVI